MTILKNHFTLLSKTVVGVLLLTVALVSCKKDSNDLPGPSSSSAVEGFYVGKYGFGNDAPDVDYKLKIKSGGVLQEIGISSGATTGQGTWQVNGNTITGIYTMLFAPYNKYSISATFNPSTGKLQGTWGGASDPTDGGKIELTKQ